MLGGSPGNLFFLGSWDETKIYVPDLHSQLSCVSRNLAARLNAIIQSEDLIRPFICHCSISTAGGGEEGQQSFWAPVRFLGSKFLELPYNPAVPLLGLCPKELESGSQRHMCTPVFSAAFFTIAKI